MNIHVWIEAIGWTLIHFLWQGGVAGASLWALYAVTSRARAQMRYLAGCLTLFATVIVAAVTFVQQVRTVRDPSWDRSREIPFVAPPSPTPLKIKEAVQAEQARAADPLSLPSMDDVSAVGVLAEDLPRNLLSQIEDGLRGFTPVIVGLWVAGVCLGLFRLWRSWCAVQRLRLSGDGGATNECSVRLTTLCRQLGLARTPALLRSAVVRVPMIVGWLKPVILVPGSLLSGLSIREIEAILAHELAHIRRHDYLVNLLQNAIETVFFYHPVVWWISARIRQEREHCCDDIAAELVGGAAHYVRALSALEEQCAAEARFSIAANGGCLLARVRRLLAADPAEGPTTGGVAGGAAIFAVLTAFVLPLALLKAADPEIPPQKDAVHQLGGGDTAKPDHFREFDQVKRGDIWPANLLEHLPFGPKNPLGLRAAWIFRPMQEQYEVGDALVSRLIIHNSGSAPVEFITDNQNRDAEWRVVNGNGTPMTLTETRYAGGAEQRARLAPGESLELPAYGLGIGLGDFDRVYGAGPIAMKLPAKPGDEFRCKWEVSLMAAWTDEAVPKPMKLETGEVKFRIVARDPQEPKPLGIAVEDGSYVVAPGIKLRITQVRMGPPIRIVNGVEKLAPAGMPAEGSVMNWGSLEMAAARSKNISVHLPKGENSYVIAWERGGTTLWVGEADWVRKLDISTVGRFPAAEVLERVDPLKRDEVEKFLLNAGTGIPEQRWKWDAGDFGSIPTQVRAALVQHRPKTNAKVAVPEPAYPVDEADPRLPWRAIGQVTDATGKPMPDVEIWVHAGVGSLKRTGFTKTDTAGRYEVEFGPGVMMEKGSSQLQVANVTAHKDGLFEKNLNRHGAGAAALREVSADDLKGYGVTVQELALPGKPREVNFVMAPAKKIKGGLVGRGSFPRLPPQDYRVQGEKPIAGATVTEGSPLRRWQVWLTGPELPPATSVFASAKTDEEGRFEFTNVPAGFKWQIQADTHLTGTDPRSPLFTGPWESDLILEVELDEKQTALKFVPATAKPEAPGAAGTNDRAKQPGAPQNLLFAEGAGPVTPLMAAAEDGNLQGVKRRLADGEDPNARTSDKSASGALIGGITPLYAAAVRGHVEVVEALLEGGAQIKAATTANGRFPLMEIIHSIKDQTTLERMAKLLLQRGADPNQPNRRVGGALHFAVMQNKPAVVRLLVDAGGKLDTKNHDGKTPLDLADQQDLKEMVHLLTELSSKAESEAGRNNSPK